MYCTNISAKKNPETQQNLGGVNFFGFKLKYNNLNDKIFWESVKEYWNKTDIIISNVDYKKEISNSDGSGILSRKLLNFCLLPVKQEVRAFIYNIYLFVTRKFGNKMKKILAQITLKNFLGVHTQNSEST